jgi:putative endonuclease
MYLYIIQSKKDFSFYIGITNNLQKRLKEHNQGLSPATRFKKPWILIYCEWYRSERDALRRERRLKRYKTAWRRVKERIRYSILSDQS